MSRHVTFGTASIAAALISAIYLPHNGRIGMLAMKPPLRRSPATTWQGRNRCQQISGVVQISATTCGTWQAAGHWALSQIRAANVTIGKAGNYTVTIAATDPPFTVSSLTLSGTGNHMLMDHGILSVDGRTTIRGNTLEIAADGTASLSNVRLNSTSTVIDEGVLSAFGVFAGSGGTVYRRRGAIRERDSRQQHLFDLIWWRARTR